MVHIVIDETCDHIGDIVDGFLPLNGYGVIFNTPGIFGCFFECEGGLLPIPVVLFSKGVAVFADFLFEFIAFGDLIYEGS